METRRFGSSDVEVSVVGLGCNQFGRKLDLGGTHRVLDAAIDAGVTHLDTADIYGGAGKSEELMGEVLRGRRDQVVLATKFGMDMGDGETRRGRPEYMRAAFAASLRRLQTDYLDIYWFHKPDPDTPLEETRGAMEELVAAGKVRAIGISQADAQQLEGFAGVQNQYSFFERAIESEVMPAAEKLDISIIPFFPLARGLLTGKYRRGEDAPSDGRLAGEDSIATDEQFNRLEALAQFAQKRGVTLVDIAIGWLAAQPQVASVIAGATKPEQVHANAAAGAWKPSADDLRELSAI